MKTSAWVATLSLAAVMVVAGIVLLRTEPPKAVDPHGHESGHEEEHDADADPTGPHGGRIVKAGDVSVESSIFEEGVPPEFRLFATDDHGDPLSLDPAGTSIILTRESRQDTITFRAQGDFLQSLQEIAEPHEFDVYFQTTRSGTSHEVRYHQEEAHGHGSDQAHGAGGSLGGIRPSVEQLKHNGVNFATAGPGSISHQIELPGEIVLNADQVAHIVPRFPGVVQKVFKNLGDRVSPGDVLAIIQSNESGAPYDVKSLIGGTIIEKHVTLGEFVRDDADLFVVADLSSVWAQISIYTKYLSDIRPGLNVRLKATGISEEASGIIDYVGPLVGENTRTAEARIVVQNPRGAWRPGLFVTARVIVDEIAVPLAVPDEAIQTVEGRSVVFVRQADALEARPITTGRSDGDWVEVLEGLMPGDIYAASNTFILKAEFGKSEAGHDH